MQKEKTNLSFDLIVELDGQTYSLMVSPEEDQYVLSIDAEEIARIKYDQETDSWSQIEERLPKGSTQKIGEAIEKYYL